MQNKMNTFLIFIEDEFHLPVIVKAKTKKQALVISNEYHFKHDKLFREHVYDYDFAGKFWAGNKEQEEYFYKTGKSKLTDKEFKKNVFEYFKENKKFAEIYLFRWFKSEKESKKIKFPKKMIKFMWIKENKDDRHGNHWCKFKIVNLEKIPKL